MGNKKQGVGSRDKVGRFWTHDALRSSFMVPTKTRHPCFPSLSSPWVVIEVMAHATCWTCFFGQTLAMWLRSPLYKHILFTCQYWFFCSVSGLNHVFLICIRLSLGANTICLGYNMGGVNCLNVGDGSQCFSCQRSKSRLSQCTAYMITWLKVVGLGMVNKWSFTSPQSPNFNWLMNATLSHEMSHAS
jgi:hypothetical protein